MANNQANTDSIVAAMIASDRFNETQPVTAQEHSSDEPLTLRRWDGAKTDRLNEAHWAGANGQPINADLHADLKTLRARITKEVANNPIAQGIINTYAVDLTGAIGPTLQVQSDNDEYNEALEKVWSEIWESPDFNGQLSGVDMIRQWVNLWFTKGEHLVQEVTLPEADTAVQWRALNLDPERLDTDFGSLGDNRVALGVRRSREGRPLGYQLRDEEPMGVFQIPTGKFTEYPADEIIHGFIITEPGQVRGFPWYAPAVPVMADLRDFDVQVLDAVRQAADMALYFYTKDPDVQFTQYQQTSPIQRRTQSFVPPGYEPFQLEPKQPSTNYVEYRSERLRELGRPVSMPLMKIMLGSEKHNFASARMDHLNYARALEAVQRWLEFNTLNRMVRSVAREAILVRLRGQFLLPPPPPRVKLVWTWPKLPAVDPIKERQAEKTGLENGTLSYAEACAAAGRDEDQVIASRKRSAKKLADAGLPPLPAPKTVVGQATEDPPEVPRDQKKKEPALA